jgi:hypothetical protein
MSDVKRASRIWTRLAVAAAAFLLPVASPPLPAQEPGGEEGEGREYSRALKAEGDVRLVRAYDGETVPLETNVPVVAGDRIEAGSGSRLEIQLSDGSYVRAAGPARLDVHSLADPLGEEQALTHLRLESGDLSVDLTGAGGDDGRDFQVDTPACTLYPMTRGLVRLHVDADGRARVWVREGVAEVAGAGRTHLLRGGQSTECAPGEPPSKPGASLPRLDAFERWVDERRGELGEAVADEETLEELPEAVQPYAGELSLYGRWQTVPTYGLVWIPSSLPSAWYPYYYGYWLGSPIGYTWVSYEPWGWAPYHYGRWSWAVGIGWVWIPGGVFSGAWVQWYPGPAYVAWVPLGWRDLPAINVGVIFSRGYRHPPGGWACVPYSHFYTRDLPRRYLRSPEQYREHLSRAVPVRHLPRFRPQDLRTRAGVLGSQIYERARLEAQARAPRRFHPAALASGSGDSGRSPIVRSRPVAVRGERRVARPALAVPTGPSAHAAPLRPAPVARAPRRPPAAPPERAEPTPEAARPQAGRGGRESGADSSIRDLLERLSRPAPAAPARLREATRVRAGAAERQHRLRAPERHPGHAPRQPKSRADQRGPSRH